MGAWVQTHTRNDVLKGIRHQMNMAKRGAGAPPAADPSTESKAERMMPGRMKSLQAGEELPKDQLPSLNDKIEKCKQSARRRIRAVFQPDTSCVDKIIPASRRLLVEERIEEYSEKRAERDRELQLDGGGSMRLKFAGQAGQGDGSVLGRDDKPATLEAREHHLDGENKLFLEDFVDLYPEYDMYTVRSSYDAEQIDVDESSAFTRYTAVREAPARKFSVVPSSPGGQAPPPSDEAHGESMQHLAFRFGIDCDDILRLNAEATVRIKINEDEAYPEYSKPPLKLNGTRTTRPSKLKTLPTFYDKKTSWSPFHEDAKAIFFTPGQRLYLPLPPMASLDALKARAAGVMPRFCLPNERDEIQKRHDDKAAKKKKIITEMKGPSLQTAPLGLHRCLGWTFYNDLGFKIPVWNIFHGFLTWNGEPVLWNQFEVFLDNVGITAALMLALVVTFYSSVSYYDISVADLRFGYGTEGSYFSTPWDSTSTQYRIWQENASLPGGGRFLEEEGEVVQKCEYEFCETVICTTGKLSDGTNCTVGEDLTGRCPFPCFESRRIDGDGTIASGAYAKWWYENRDQSLAFGSTEHVLPSAMFSYTCIFSASYLLVAVLMTIILVGLTSMNRFARDANPSSYSSVVVFKSFSFWLRINVLLIIVFAYLGAWYFFDVIEYMVMLKYTDAKIVEYDLKELPLGDQVGTGDHRNVYAYAHSIRYSWVYTPSFLMMLIYSAAQWAAYTYPVAPYATKLAVYNFYGSFVFRWMEAAFSMFSKSTDDKDDDGIDWGVGDDPDEGIKEITEYRLAKVLSLIEFLVLKCGLPMVTKLEPSNEKVFNVPLSGPRELAADVYLSVASGVAGTEAEIVASALVDNHIDSAETLIQMCKDEDTRSWIAEVPGISLGAAVKIWCGVDKILGKEVTNMESKSRVDPVQAMNQEKFRRGEKMRKRIDEKSRRQVLDMWREYHAGKAELRAELSKRGGPVQSKLSARRPSHSIHN